KACKQRAAELKDGAAVQSGAREAGGGILPNLHSADSVTHGDAAILAMIQTRVAKKDPVAIYYLGEKFFHGELGLQKDMRRAVELWTEAAELGSVEALGCLGGTYHSGNGVQEDKAKGVEFWTKAAMQGHDQRGTILGVTRDRRGTTTVQ
ncbi:hypothetical protein THAOC_17466, partial [Thalassiosira oceanica]